MGKWAASKLKREFADYYLWRFLNLKTTENKYQTTSLKDDDGTTSISLGKDGNPNFKLLIDTEKIVKDLNRYLESYFLFTVSGLDCLAHELFEGLSLTNPNKNGNIYFRLFKRHIVIKELGGRKPRVKKIIEEFLGDSDYENFNKCRRIIAHEKILNAEVRFKEKMGSPLEIIRPIPAPKIVEKIIKRKNLEKWLNKINKKIINFYEKIYGYPPNYRKK